MGVNPLGGTVAATPDAGGPSPFGMGAPPPGAFPPPPGAYNPNAPPAFGAPAFQGDMGAGQPAPYAMPPADGPSGGAPFAGPNMNIGAQQAMVPVGAPMGVPMAQPGYGAPGMAPMGGVGPKGQTRNPIMVLIISAICFLYGIYQYYSMLGELKAFLNSDEIQPWHMFIPILNILLLFKIPGWVLEAKRRAGVPNPEVSNIIFYWFFGLYFFPKDLNEVWNPTGQLTA
jgi:hypothetical protein